MGKSKGSCLKIIACGSDSTVNEDTPSQYKSSSDKRGWSFRKRSARHRVLINTVETPSSLSKEIPEVVSNDLQTQPKETFTEKTTAVTWTDDLNKEIPEVVSNDLQTQPKETFTEKCTATNEMPQPTVVSKACDTTVLSESEKANDVNPDESVIVVIQASIRGFLVRRQILKVKNVVKLQAAVRGHLVRSHAVGTLRCVQAIVKIQGLVRARQARISLEAKSMDKETSTTKPQVGYISIKKLLSNKFAHQLLESTPQTKPINIKCDPSSKSDSAWNWLERWMLVSSKEADTKSPSEGCELTDTEADNVQAAVVDQNSIISNSDVVSKSDDLDTAMSVVSDTLITKDISAELISEEIKKLDSVSEAETEAVSSKPQMEIEQPAKSIKRSASEASEEVESEGKRFAFGTRKATNPAFIGVQSKFNELSTTPSLARSTSSCRSNFIDNDITRREVEVGENSLSTSSVKVGDSECGTELSVTSTLDSPDRLDMGVANAEFEIEIKKKGSHNSFEDLDDKTKAEPDSEISNTISLRQDKPDKVNGTNFEESVIPVVTVAPELEKTNLATQKSNEKVNLNMEEDHQASASAGASPKSQMIVPEFQETPSSQVSGKAKRTNREKSLYNKKTKSSSAGKSSPSNPNQNSGTKSGLDGFPKETNSSKRRNSFGSAKSDYADQEPRDSSSSNSLPKYMQATESARAKALANSSPRSSPDVHEKNVYVKKRHSLPGANEKHGSPRFQHSKSEAHQAAKANGHPQERKWQR